MIIPEESLARLNVLNCNLGDLKLSFDQNDPADVENARATVTDLLAKGFLIFIQTPEGTVRATGFDPKTNEYLVKQPEPKAKQKPGPKGPRRIKAAGAKATAVARTGGG